MFCRNCGFNMADNAKFCMQCGKQVMEQQSVSSINAIQQTVQRENAQYNENKKKQSIKKLPLVIGLSIIVLVVGAVVALFVIKDSSKSTIKKAYNKTIEMLKNPDTVFERELGLNEIIEKVMNQAVRRTIELDASDTLIYANIDTDLKNSKAKAMFTHHPNVIPVSQVDIYADKEQLMFGCMDIIERYLYVNYDELKQKPINPYLANYNGDYYADIINLYLDSISYIGDFKEYFSERLMEFADSFTYDKETSKTFIIGKNNVECDGYKVIITSDELRSLIIDSIDYLKNHGDTEAIVNKLLGFETNYLIDVDYIYKNAIESVEVFFAKLPKCIELYVYINGDYIVDVITNIEGEESELEKDNNWYTTYHTISGELSILGEQQNLWDDIEFNCELFVKDSYHEFEGNEGINLKIFKDENKRNPQKENIVGELTITDYDYTQAYTGRFSYDKESNELHMEFWDIYQKNGYGARHKGYELDGRFTKVKKGESFKFEVEDTQYEYNRLYDLKSYSIEPCKAVEPFTDCNEAINILDIDENTMSKIIDNIQRLMEEYYYPKNDFLEKSEFEEDFEHEEELGYEEEFEYEEESKFEEEKRNELCTKPFDVVDEKKKQLISTITFLDYIQDCEGEIYDVSESKDESVILRLKKNGDLYDAFFEADGKIYAPIDCTELFSIYWESGEYSDYPSSNLGKIEFNNNFDTSNSTNMKDMFMSCAVLDNLDLSCFDTSNVTNMENMFAECVSLEYLNVSSFNTGKVTDMSGMFASCSRKELDVSNFDTSNVVDMEYMFYDSASIEYLDLSNFVTDKVENMTGMFENCWSLKDINVRSFNTKNVKSMDYMFSVCISLEYLDISNFDLSNASTQDMFWGVECEIKK